MQHRTHAMATVQNNDLYQFVMSQGYFKAGRHLQTAIFDYYFRKCPFEGHFAIFSGLRSVHQLLNNFRLEKEFLQTLKVAAPFLSQQYLEYLSKLTLNGVEVAAVLEGEVVFPCEPLLRIKGPLLTLQLLQTPILNLVGFSTLTTTYAHRIVRAAGKSRCVELGLRRAQGPNGGLTASYATYLGGFDGTSNTLAAHVLKVPCFGSMAHAYITSFTGLQNLQNVVVKGTPIAGLVLEERKKKGWLHSNIGELAAFISFTQVDMTPKYYSLLDTYDTVRSGMANFICVATVLARLGYSQFFARLDSGDLAALASQCKALWNEHMAEFKDRCSLTIIASNDLCEKTVTKLVEAEAQIDIYGIGTNVVTCKSQPSLGIVCKLVELEGRPILKLSEDVSKVMLAGCKATYRVWQQDSSVSDVIALASQTVAAGKEVQLVTAEGKSVKVTPQKVQPLLAYSWSLDKRPQLMPLEKSREYVKQRVSELPRQVFEVKGQPHRVLQTRSLFQQQSALLLSLKVKAE